MRPPSPFYLRDRKITKDTIKKMSIFHATQNLSIPLGMIITHGMSFLAPVNRPRPTPPGQMLAMLRDRWG